MGVKTFLSGLLVFVIVIMLAIYWFVPMQTIEFNTSGNSNFSLYNFNEEMQFYKNMRFPAKDISYNIDDKCALQKRDDMLNAFNWISNETILRFYPVKTNEEITITCDDKNRVEGGLFIAGEGGPANVTQTKNFNVITKGKIILIKNSDCPTPNIATHELLHVLGFNHSANSNNIMYPVTNCRQTLGDIPSLINELYYVESYPDLEIENVSAMMNGKYLDINISIRNNGLVKSESSVLVISSGEDIIKEVELNPLEVGYGMQVAFRNIWVAKISVDEIDVSINYSSNELDKNNNKRILKIKEN
jgi:hypothetical protein